jgi:chemotaxis protein CheY-P-specific phosphatase CheC
MMGKQIVVEKNRVVSVLTQKFFSVINRFGNVYIVAIKSFDEPTMSSLIIIEQKNCDRIAFSLQICQTEFY